MLHLICVSAGSRPSLIMQSHPPDVPRSTSPEMLLSTSERRKKQRERNKDENEHMNKNALYDIVSTPSKDSTKLTLKLSRVKMPDVDQSEKAPTMSRVDTDQVTDSRHTNNNQLSSTPQDFSLKVEAEEQTIYQQVAVQPSTKETEVISGVVFDDSEMDALAEIERIERESASDRERCSKEVQDKGESLCD